MNTLFALFFLVIGVVGVVVGFITHDSESRTAGVAFIALGTAYNAHARLDRAPR